MLYFLSKIELPTTNWNNIVLHIKITRETEILFYSILKMKHFILNDLVHYLPELK